MLSDHVKQLLFIIQYSKCCLIPLNQAGTIGLNSVLGDMHLVNRHWKPGLSVKSDLNLDYLEV